MKRLSRRVHRRGVHHTGQVASPLEAERALRASVRISVRGAVRGSLRRARRRRHRNQRRLSAHIPRLHPLVTYAAQAVRTGLSLLEPMFLASSELLGYRSFTHRGRNIYYRVDNLHLLTESESAPGVLFYFDGDHLSRVGSRLLRRTSPLRAELAQVAAEFNMLSVPVLSPGSLREPRLTDGDSYAPPLTYQLVGSRPLKRQDGSRPHWGDRSGVQGGYEPRLAYGLFGWCGVSQLRAAVARY